jgi:hypothetical protein
MIDLVYSPVFSVPAFNLWTEIVRYNFSFLPLAAPLVDLSFQLLNRTTDLSISLPILGFWSVAAGEAAAYGDPFIGSLLARFLPLFFRIFTDNFPDRPSPEPQWDLETASGDAIGAFCRAEPERALALLEAPLSQPESDPRFILHAIYSLMASGHRAVVSKLSPVAVSWIAAALQAPSPNVMNYGLLILQLIAKYTVVPPDYLRAAFEILSSCDGALARNAAKFVSKLVIRHPDEVDLPAIVGQTMAALAPSNTAITIDLLTSLIRYSHDQDISTVVASEIISFLAGHPPNDETLSASLALFRVAAMTGGIGGCIESVVRFAFSLEDSVHASESLFTIAVIARSVGSQFGPYVLQMLAFLDSMLTTRNSYIDVVAALEGFEVVVASLDLSWYVVKFVANVLEIMRTPGLAEFAAPALATALGATAVSCPGALAEFGIVVAEILDAIADVMERGEADVGLASAAVECTRFALKIEGQGEVREKMVGIAIKVVNVMRYFDEMPPAILIGVVSLLSILAGVLAEGERQAAFRGEAFRVVLQQALRADDDHVRSEVEQILEVVGIRR